MRKYTRIYYSYQKSYSAEPWAFSFEIVECRGAGIPCEWHRCYNCTVHHERLTRGSDSRFGLQFRSMADFAQCVFAWLDDLGLDPLRSDVEYLAQQWLYAASSVSFDNDDLIVKENATCERIWNG